MFKVQVLFFYHLLLLLVFAFYYLLMLKQITIYTTIINNIFVARVESRLSDRRSINLNIDYTNVDYHDKYCGYSSNYFRETCSLAA